MLIPDAVSGVRNDARDASDDAFAPIGQIVDGFAILEGRVFISRQGDHLFVDQPRHIVGVALVQVDGELHEAPELALGRDLPDGYAHKDIYMCMMKSVWWAAKVGQFVGVPWGEASRRGLLSMQIRLFLASAWGIRCDTPPSGYMRRCAGGWSREGDCWLHVGSILTSGMDVEFSSKVGRVLFQAINPCLGGYSTLRDRWISGVSIMAYYPHSKRVLPR